MYMNVCLLYDYIRQSLQKNSNSTLYTWHYLSFGVASKSYGWCS